MVASTENLHNVMYKVKVKRRSNDVELHQFISYMTRYRINMRIVNKFYYFDGLRERRISRNALTSGRRRLYEKFPGCGLENKRC